MKKERNKLFGLLCGCPRDKKKEECPLDQIRKENDTKGLWKYAKEVDEEELCIHLYKCDTCEEE